MNGLPNFWPSQKPWVIGDCNKIMEAIPDSSIDLVIADPPFNLGKDYGTTYDDKRQDYIEWSRKWIENAFRILKPSGSFYHMNYITNLPAMWGLMAEYGVFRNCIIWKNTKNSTKSKYVNAFQPILFFTKTDTYSFDNGAEFKKPETKGPLLGFNKESRITDIWSDIPFIPGGCLASKEAILSKDNGLSKAHPCQMPIKLAERMIKFSTKPGDIVFDPFLGSGTTIRAARHTGRIGIGTEINPEYEWVIIEQTKAKIRPVESWFIEPQPHPKGGVA